MLRTFVQRERVQVLTVCRSSVRPRDPRSDGIPGAFAGGDAPFETCAEKLLVDFTGKFLCAVSKLLPSSSDISQRD